MKTCPNCRAMADDDALYCTNCGMRLESSPLTQPAMQVPPTTPSYSYSGPPTSVSPQSSAQYAHAPPYRSSPAYPTSSMQAATRKAPSTGKTYVLGILLGIRTLFTFLSMDLFLWAFSVGYLAALIQVIRRDKSGGIIAMIIAGIDLVIALLLFLAYGGGAMVGAIIVDLIIIGLGYGDYQDCQRFHSGLPALFS